MGKDRAAHDRCASAKKHAGEHRRYQPNPESGTSFPSPGHLAAYPEAAGLVSRLRCWGGVLENGPSGVRLVPPVDPLTPPRFFDEIMRLQGDLVALLAPMGDAPTLTGRIQQRVEPNNVLYEISEEERLHAAD